MAPGRRTNQTAGDGHVELSVLIPTYNERRFIADCAQRMREQTFAGGVELLFVDGGSDDGTREFLDDLAGRDDRVRVFENPARRTPNALNIGLAAARGEFVARMDAHTFYPPGYLEAGVTRMRRGGVDWVSGPALPRGAGRFSERVALGMESPIGIGGATFRRVRESEFETDTGFTGILRRDALQALGGWDEGWPVNQDGELAGRVRAAGGRIICLPEMAAGLVTRDSPRALARQYWRYGFYRVKTSRRHPATLRRSHLLPPLLVAGLLTAASGRGPARATRLAASLYPLVLLAGAARMARRGGTRAAGSLPFVWAIMHLAWGAGFIAGCARMGPPLAAVRAALRPPAAAGKATAVRAGVAGRIRLLILLDIYWSQGGAERLAVAIAAHLPADRYEVCVCTTRSQPDDGLARALENTGVRHLDLARSGRHDVLAFGRLIRFLRAERIDIVHAHKFGSNIWGTVLGRLCRIPVVIAHEHTWSYVGQPIRRVLDGAVISRLADTFVAVSNADRDRMISIEHVRPEKITVIPTAYIPRPSADHGDVRTELGIDPQAAVVGTLAVMRPQKALHVLVEAFALLPERLSDVRLILAGDGRCRAALEAQAAASGLQGRVHFLGMRDDPDAVWRACDIAAISSDFEGSPIAAIEAMTNGTPLVATRVGGLPELLEHDVSALLVAPRDAAALARALTLLLDDRALRTRLADEARRVAQTLSLERLISTTDGMYVELLAGTRRGREARA